MKTPTDPPVPKRKHVLYQTMAEIMADLRELYAEHGDFPTSRCGPIGRTPRNLGWAHPSRNDGPAPD